MPLVGQVTENVAMSPTELASGEYEFTKQVVVYDGFVADTVELVGTITTVAIVLPQSVAYDNAFHGGMTIYTFSVLLLVSRVSERTGQDSLDSWVSSTGSNSIKLAIESDKTLGGYAYDIRVSEVRNYGELLVGDVNYFSAEFIILCYSD